MPSKSGTTHSEPAKPLPVFEFGRNQTEAMLNVQKEMMSACEHASRSWADRINAEVELWSDLASKLSKAGSAPNGLQACQDSVAKRLKMAVEDGQRVFDEGQRVLNAVTRSFGNGWPKSGA